MANKVKKKFDFTRSDFKRHMKVIADSAHELIVKECMAVFDKMTEDERWKLNRTFYDQANDEHVPMVYYLAKNVLTSIDVNELLRRQFRAESMNDTKRAMMAVIRRQV